jgi:hypothetical protein
MKTDSELEMNERSALERQYLDELPQILVTSEDDLGAAVAALDRYLSQAPPPKLQKSLLAWKGHFYLEHGMYDDATRVLQVADRLNTQDDLQNFNTKFDLAEALEKGTDPQGAYAVLTAGLDEIKEPSLLLNILHALVRLMSSSAQSMPLHADAALSRAKEFYGIEDPSTGDLPAETVRVAELVHDAGVRFNRLRAALRGAESPAEKVGLVEEYLNGVTVPRFKQLAEDLLRRILEGTTG